MENKENKDRGREEGNGGSEDERDCLLSLCVRVSSCRSSWKVARQQLCSQ